MYAKPGDSQFWKGLMGVKEQFIQFGRFVLKDGSQIRFWEDKWLGNTTLGEQYPILYNIVRSKNDTVATVLQSVLPNISFRRYLVGDKLIAWHNLLQN